MILMNRFNDVAQFSTEVLHQRTGKSKSVTLAGNVRDSQKSDNFGVEVGAVTDLGKSKAFHLFHSKTLEYLLEECNMCFCIKLLSLFSKIKDVDVCSVIMY